MFKRIQVWEISLVEDIFEKFSQWTQKWVGLDCFFWATLVRVVQSLVGAVLTAICVQEKGFMIPTVIPMLTIITFLRNLVDISFNIASIKMRAYTDARQSRKNRILIEDSAIRSAVALAILILIPAMGIKVLATRTVETVPVLISLMFVMEYTSLAFMSCTPLPSGKSKFKQWMTRVGESIQQSLVPGLPTPT